MPTLAENAVVAKPGRGSENKVPVVAAVSSMRRATPGIIKLATAAHVLFCPIC